VASEIEPEIRQLKEAPGAGIVSMGGPTFRQELVRLGLGPALLLRQLGLCGPWWSGRVRRSYQCLGGPSLGPGSVWAAKMTDSKC